MRFRGLIETTESSTKNLVTLSLKNDFCRATPLSYIRKQLWKCANCFSFFSAPDRLQTDSALVRYHKALPLFTQNHIVDESQHPVHQKFAYLINWLLKGIQEK
jgi:hypothetical protein